MRGAAVRDVVVEERAGKREETLISQRAETAAQGTC